MEKMLDTTYRALRFFTDKIVGYFAALVMLGATGLALVEIVRRYVIGVTFHWGQDAVTYFIVGSISLFFAVTQARRSHLAMSVVLDLLKAKGMGQAVMCVRAVVSLLSLCFYAAFAWWGWPTVERMWMMGTTTQSMLLVIWPFQLMLLVGFVLMALAAAFQLYQDVHAIFGRKVFPWAETEEGLEI
jgi:TRAP-type C4-dicarboxylate transport system permease small subunit